MCTAGEAPCTYTTATGDTVCDCRPGMTPVWACTACPACPATQPTGVCTAAPATCGAAATCTYGATDCTCAIVAAGGGGAGGRMWACGACPATEPAPAPAAATTCTTVGLACDYGTTRCTCRPAGGGAAGGDAFVCLTPPPTPMCPATQPTAGAMCTAADIPFAGCPYGTAMPPTRCRCRPAAEGGAGDEWACD
jgi:hypothetical protein